MDDHDDFSDGFKQKYPVILHCLNQDLQDSKTGSPKKMNDECFNRYVPEHNQSS